VDEVFLNEYIQHYKVSIVVLSESYKDKFSELNINSKVVYLPRGESEYKKVEIDIAKNI
jgi:hypothetical protein